MKKVRHIRCDCAEHWGGEVRSENYDAYYCPYCNKWLEKKCSDPDCKFCANRSKKPVGKT